MRRLKRRMRREWMAIGSLVAGILSGLPAPGQDWPGWGGSDPGRNMYSPAKGLPLKFKVGTRKASDEEIDPKTTENVKWVAKLGSQSYGNPVVAGGKIYVGTNNDSPRDPQHTGDRSILLCLDEKTGEFLWQLVVPKLASGRVNDWPGLGICASPYVEGDKVYLVSSRCEVLCLDANGMANGNDGPFKDEAKYVVRDTEKQSAKIGPKDADILWKYDIMDELGVFPHNASSCSVIVVDDIVYVITSNGVDWGHKNIPAPNAPSLIALNKKTGELLGEDDARVGPKIFHSLYSSPSAGKVNGKQLIFFGGGDGVCYAFDAKPVKPGDEGVLKTVWSYDCNPPEYRMKDGKPIPYATASGPSEIIATPVFYKNRVYVAIGQDPEHDTGLGNLVCIDATKTGDVTRSATVWSKKIDRSMSTVSIDPETGLLFIADFTGFVHCLDADTGKEYWTHDTKSHIWGSTLVADGKVYIGDEQGILTVLEAKKEKKVISETDLEQPTYATPIVANGVLYVATQSYLYAVQDKSKPAGDEIPKVKLKK